MFKVLLYVPMFALSMKQKRYKIEMVGMIIQSISLRSRLSARLSNSTSDTP